MDVTNAITIIIWVVSGATLVFVITLGFVLQYHWSQFAVNRRVARLAVTLYTLVSIALLLSLLAFLPARIL